MFYDGGIHGVCIYTNSHGSCYEQEWYEGKSFGKCTYYGNSGTIYNDEFEGEAMPNAFVDITETPEKAWYKNGNFHTAIWDNWDDFSARGYNR